MLCLTLCLAEHSKASRSIADMDVVDPAKVAGKSDVLVAYCYALPDISRYISHVQK